jgi:hypothetical protein
MFEVSFQSCADMTMGAEDDWRLGEPALGSAGVVWSEVVVNVSRQRSGVKRGEEIGYYCGSLSRSRCGILLWMLVETTGEREDRIVLC